MSIAMQNNSVGPLDAQDPGLPFLASEAAIELDNLLIGQGDSSLSAVGRLARRLENSTEQIAGSNERRPLMDPATVTVFSSAIAASGHTEVRTLSELAERASVLAQALHGLMLNSEKRQIESLRAFCVYLSQSAVAHERSLYEMHNAERNRS